MNSHDMTQDSNHQDLELSFVHHLRRIESRDDLDEDQKRRLAHKARKGSEDALHRLVDATLPPVVRLARKYQGTGLALMDLIAEGTVGLVKAVRGYNEGRHGPFTPYALRLAHQEIQTATGV